MLTALEVEYKVVRSFLNDIEEEELDDGTIFERGIPINCQNSVVYLRECGKGNYKSALSTEKLIKYVNPDYAFFIGVAGGIKDLNLCDVIVGEKVYGYESGKSGDKLQTRPELGKSNYRLVERAKVESRSGDWKKLLNGDCNKDSKVLIGNIVAGEKVLISESNDLYQIIKNNYNDAQAVEMEGIGFMEAIYQNDNIPSIVLRGISDLLSNKNETDKTNSQEEACRNAAAFGFYLLPKLAKSKQGKNSSTVRFRLKIDSDIPLKDEAELNRIISQINKIAIPDNHSLTLNKIEVGSTILNFESNSETLAKLIELSKSGELSELLGYPTELEIIDEDNDSNPISFELQKSTRSAIFWEGLRNFFDENLNKIEIEGDNLFSTLIPRRIGKLEQPTVRIYCGAIIEGRHSPVIPKKIELISTDALGYRAVEYYNPTPGILHFKTSRDNQKEFGTDLSKGMLKAFITNPKKSKFSEYKLNKKYEGFIVRMEDIADSIYGVSEKINLPLNRTSLPYNVAMKQGYIFAIIENLESDQWDEIKSLRLHDFEVSVDNIGYDDNDS